MKVFSDVENAWRGRSHGPDGVASNGRIDAAELLASAIGGERRRDATLLGLEPYRNGAGRFKPQPGWGGQQVADRPGPASRERDRQ